ncbi:MAG: hypothetical protein Q9188_004551 [Gyalolechia gomerana]
MNPVHRPDFDVIRRELRGPDHRDAPMMPCINLEDLSSGKNLLNLIVSRTKMCPEHFAWVESILFKTATTMNAVRPAAQFPKVMLLTGQKTQDACGRLREVDDQADVEHTVWTGFDFQLGQGLVVLETPTEIVPLSATINRASPGLPDTTITPDPSEWQSVSNINTQASYQLPQPFPLESVWRLAGPKRDAAEDLLWTLHEDPAYFQEQLNLKIEQNMEPRRKAFGTSYEAEDAALKQACVHIIHDACRHVIVWEAIAVAMIELEAIKASLGVGIQLSKHLPLRYGKALENFIALTHTFIDLVNTENGRWLEYISKLAALAQIRDALVRHQPTIQTTEGVGYNSILHHHMARFKVIGEFEEHLARITLRAHSKPISAFNYPVGKKRTSQYIEQMGRAEAKVDVFWEQVVREFVPRTGKTVVSWMGHRLNAREIHRTQPWHPDDQKAVQPSIPESPYRPISDSSPDTIEEFPTEPRKKPKTKGETDPSRNTFTTESTAAPATIWISKR